VQGATDHSASQSETRHRFRLRGCLKTNRSFVFTFCFWICLVCATLVASELAAQESDLDWKDFDPDRFTFVRIVYDSVGGNGEAFYRGDRGWIPRWATDHPDGAKNLTWRLHQLTTIKANQGTLLLRLDDPKLMDFPFAFMSDPGWQQLRVDERTGLRSFLERGGFLWVDDFWGKAEWDNLVRNTMEACPTFEWRDIPNDHPILSIVYPLDGCPQITAIQFYRRGGVTYDPPFLHKQPHGGVEELSQVRFRGFFKPDGSLVAVATHNTDIADGWEREGEDEEFFQRFSVKAYALAVNILTYAMSHSIFWY
jgi:hypothetical protein